jgi:hypothetical protein
MSDPWMSLAEGLLGLVLAAVSLLLLLELRRAFVRRRRRLHYERLARDRRERHEAPPAKPGMSPDQALRIRRDAEAAARAAWAADGREPVNPNPKHTPEFVLWAATYHLTIAVLAEASEPPLVPVGEPGPAPQ